MKMILMQSSSISKFPPPPQEKQKQKLVTCVSWPCLHTVKKARILNTLVHFILGLTTMELILTGLILEDQP